MALWWPFETAKSFLTRELGLSDVEVGVGLVEARCQHDFY
jgi:hypothetical protein